MLAYWRLSEVNDGTVAVFKDSSMPGTHTFNPMSGTLNKTVQQLMEFREVYLKMCPEGTYAKFNDKKDYVECLACNASCKNCIAPDGNKCSECNAPLKLLQEEMTCIIVESCPQGYYMDQETGLCFKCNPFCIECVNS